MNTRSLKVLKFWSFVVQTGKIPEDQIAGAVYFGITDSPPPPEVVKMRDFVELCDYFNKQDTGNSFTQEEREQLIQESLRMAREGGMPSPTFMRLLIWLPNVVVFLAIFAVVFRSFSWLVIALALLGKIQNGFAKYLAGQSHKAAGLHVAIALLFLALSATVSFLHILSIYKFP